MSSTEPNADNDLERFRSYLTLLARAHMGKRLLAHLDPADVVQQALLDAHRSREQFRGAGERERLAWLRGILAHNIADAGRRLGTEMRDVRRERSLEAALELSSQNLEHWLIAQQSSPSVRAQRTESLVRLADALAQLPETQREVLVLRHCHGLTFADIGQRLGCTAPTVVGFLKRGSRQLRALLEGESS